VYLDADGSARVGLAALVRALLNVGEARSLERLTSYVQTQPERELRALARIVAKTPGVPPPFRHAVGDAVAALPPGKAGLLTQLVDEWGSWFEQ
jgi:hypothetical protein